MEQARSQKPDIGKYLRILNRRKWWGIVPFFILIPLVVLASFWLPVKYPAECILAIGSTQSEEELAHAGRADRELIARSKLQHITTGMLTYRNIRELIPGAERGKAVLGLADGIDVNDEIQVEKLVEKIRNEVQIIPEGTEYIRVRYLGGTQKISEGVVNELVGKFLEDWVRKVREDQRQALDSRDEQLDQYRGELERATEDLRRFREGHAKELLARDPDYLVKKLGDLKERLAEIDWELGRNKKEAEFKKELLESTPEIQETSATFRPSVYAVKLDQTIAELKVSKLLMSDHYTPDHPKIKRIQDQLGALEAERAETEDEKASATRERNPTYDKLRDELNEVEGEILALESERATGITLQAQYEEDIRKLPGLMAQEGKYDSKVEELKRVIVEARKAKEDAMRRFELAQFNRINAFQRAQSHSSPRPDRSDMFKFLVMGLFATLAIAVATMISREYLDQTFTAVDEARGFLSIPSLGVVPVIVTLKDKRRRKIRRLVTIITILLVIAATVAACLTVEALRDQVNSLFERLGNALRGVSPF